jgi:hypothetical protein
MPATSATTAFSKVTISQRRRVRTRVPDELGELAYRACERKEDERGWGEGPGVAHDSDSPRHIHAHHGPPADQHDDPEGGVVKW